MCNSSYSFMAIFLKLYRYFCHGLKICMWFRYNPQINFCHLFFILNLVIFQESVLIVGTEYLLCAIPPTVLWQSF